MKRAITIDPDHLADSSAFVAETWRRFPEDADPTMPVAAPDEDALAADPLLALRRFRQLSSVHILWRDLSGQADIAETGRAISTLARDCLALALDAAERQLEARFGALAGVEGTPIRLAVLGLGKLGGDELNFNSDIDLVFAYQGTATSTGPRRLEAAEWLKQCARELIRLLDTVTAHGRVWIVDTRLRPFGDSGALVWSVPAMEQYFLSEGRSWERYAWLKAAPTAGDRDTGSALLDALQPFVFRRYLDYGIFDSLRELHTRIDASSRARSARDDIKRGAGGIRELEFLVQSQQILRGGREPSLRQRGFLPALAACRDLGLIEPARAETLETAYAFLRILENRLQAMTARQGHHLPEDDDGRRRLAALMGAANWAELAAEIASRREQVRVIFADSFREPERRSISLPLWPPSPELAGQLSDAGFEHPQDTADALLQLHGRIGSRALSAEGRQRLERLMPQLLAEVQSQDRPEAGLSDLLRLIEQIARRSAYLALLHERPATLTRLVRVVGQSARLAEWIIAAPQLLDDLLDPVHGFELPALPALDPDDIESSLHALGRWRQAGFLRTALAELDERLSPDQAAARLTSIAEAIIGAVLKLIDGQRPDLAVIAYGNLGAELMHYESDLDLVFLHGEGEPPLRTTQRLISTMQLPMPGGRLFEIDTRLRPNGRAGLLVSRIDAFADYQQEQAWTWEHQALIRARWVGGRDALRSRFDALRLAVLCQPRDPDTTRRELAEMRLKQRRERPETPIKRLRTDIQTIAECLLLCHAADHPALAAERQPTRMLASLAAAGLLAADRSSDLQAAWHELSALQHRQWLARGDSASPAPELTERVTAAWTAAFGDADA